MPVAPSGKPRISHDLETLGLMLGTANWGAWKRKMQMLVWAAWISQGKVYDLCDRANASLGWKWEKGDQFTVALPGPQGAMQDVGLWLILEKLDPGLTFYRECLQDFRRLRPV